MEADPQTSYSVSILLKPWPRRLHLQIYNLGNVLHFVMAFFVRVYFEGLKFLRFG